MFVSSTVLAYGQSRRGSECRYYRARTRPLRSRHLLLRYLAGLLALKGCWAETRAWRNATWATGVVNGQNGRVMQQGCRQCLLIKDSTVYIHN